MGNIKPLVVSLALIFGGIAVGRALLAFSRNRSPRVQQFTEKFIFLMRNIAFYFMSPFVVINAFWIIDIKSISYISVPLIGLGALVIGSSVAVLLAKARRMELKQEGAMFCAGSCSNIGSFGSLLCFVFFGQPGIVFSTLYRVFETPYYYLFLYPTAREYTADKNTAKVNRLLWLMKDPIAIIFFISIVIGLTLNLAHIPCPNFVSETTELLIPISTVLLLFSVGYTLRFSKVRRYRFAVVGISFIKYMLTPLFVIGAALLLGLNRLGDGTLFKTLIVLSALPSGFNSLIPAQMFGLDVDLVNACWLVTTILLIPVVAVIWLFVA